MVGQEILRRSDQSVRAQKRSFSYQWERVEEKRREIAGLGTHDWMKEKEKPEWHMFTWRNTWESPWRIRWGIVAKEDLLSQGPALTGLPKLCFTEWTAGNLGSKVQRELWNSLHSLSQLQQFFTAKPWWMNCAVGHPQPPWFTLHTYVQRKIVLSSPLFFFKLTQTFQFHV